MSDADAFLLIRCHGCSRPACELSCDEQALLDLRGELLVDTARCGNCRGEEGGGLPRCIDRCAYSGDKVPLEIVSLREKRARAAAILPLLGA
jgi:Fe-S-cluster-containing hydrogenase component 2